MILASHAAKLRKNAHTIEWCRFYEKELKHISHKLDEAVKKNRAKIAISYSNFQLTTWQKRCLENILNDFSDCGFQYDIRVNEQSDSYVICITLGA